MSLTLTSFTTVWTQTVTAWKCFVTSLLVSHIQECWCHPSHLSKPVSNMWNDEKIATKQQGTEKRDGNPFRNGDHWMKVFL